MPVGSPVVESKINSTLAAPYVKIRMLPGILPVGDTMATGCVCEVISVSALVIVSHTRSEVAA
jgi:hypothetical protein